MARYEVSRAKLTSKGQVTIPKAVRDSLGVRPGDEILFVNDGGVLTLRRVFNPEGLLKYKGYLKHLAGQDPDELVEEMRGR